MPNDESKGSSVAAEDVFEMTSNIIEKTSNSGNYVAKVTVTLAAGVSQPFSELAERI